jgi:hypothetical protein
MKIALVLVVAALGCGRAHLESGFGRSYHAQFDLQREHPNGTKRVRPITGLDAQEASIMATTYRRGIAPKEAQETKEQPILVVAPTQPGVGRAALMPSPSVPDKE